MSALLPKAEACGALAHVRYGPIADTDYLHYIAEGAANVVRLRRAGP